jgi:tRNA(adenine34) deaminase
VLACGLARVARIAYRSRCRLIVRKGNTVSLEEDIRWMRRALGLAQAAALAGEVPVGAVLVRAGEVLGEGGNSPLSGNDPTAHAEVCALRSASAAAGNYRLPGSTLYVSIEPCAMCAGALVHARVERLVFAAREPKAGVVVSNLQLLDAPFLNHRVRWEEGPLAEEAAAMMQAFFRGRRLAGSTA